MHTFMQRARRWLPALAAGLALATGSASAQTTKLKVMAAPTAFEALYIGQEQGIFARHGLEVEVLPGGPPDAMLPLLLNGQIQYALSSGLAVVTAAAKGLPVRIALSNLNSSQPATAALIAHNNSAVHKLEDVKDRKVGLTSLRNQPHLGVLISAEAAGIPPESISFVEIPAAAMLAAAEKGTVDAIYALDPHKSVALASGNFRFIEESVAKFMQGATAVTFAASQSFLDKNPDTARSFVAAMTEAFEVANRNPDMVRAVDVKYTRLPPEFIRERYIPPFSAEVDLAATQKMIDAMVKSGWITTAQAPALSKLVDSHAPTR